MWSTAQLIIASLLLLAPVTLGQDNSTGHSYARMLRLMLHQHHNTLELHVQNRRDYDNSFVQFLLRQQIRALRVRIGRDIPHTSEPGECVFIYEHIHQLQQNINLFMRQDDFYILVLERALDAQELLLQFMKLTWQLHGHNRIYYVLLESNQVLLYNPFLDQIVYVKNAHSYERIYSNLYGYPLRAYIFDSVYSVVFGDGTTKRILGAKGPDANVAETVASHLNFTLNYIWPDDAFFGGRQPNGTYTGGIGRAHRFEVDVIFAGFFIKDYLTTRIQFSAAAYMDDLCLFVKKAQRIPQSIVPLFAVRVDVWLCFLLVGFGCAFIWLFLRGLNLALHIRRTTDERYFTIASRAQYLNVACRIFIDTWIVWVRVNVNKFPPYNSERIFLGSLCLVSVIFGALLESSLATAYIRPLYYRDINTLEELDASQLPIYIKHPAFKDDLFFGHDSEVYRHLDAKLLLVGEGEDRLITMVSKLGKFAGVTRSASLELNDSRYITTHKVHMIPQCPKTYHIGYVLPRPSPYVTGVNTVLLQILASGLLDYWIGEMKERAKLNIHSYPEYLAEMDMGNWKVLTLKDVQLAFYALTIGCVLAALIWLIEMYFK